MSVKCPKGIDIQLHRLGAGMQNVKKMSGVEAAIRGNVF